VSLRRVAALLVISLSDCPAAQQAAVDAGAPAVIVAAMQAHVADNVSADMGCSALGRIA